jgi:hypothetical protein
MRSRAALFQLLFVVVVLAPGCVLSREDVYLTWQRDPATTMTVNYHTFARADSTVLFDTQPRAGAPTAYTQRTEGESRQLEGLRRRRYIHAIELEGLQPNTTYYFVAGDAAGGYTREKSFRTLPADATPVRFVTGGDMSILPRAKGLLTQAARWDPMFMLIGGDIAYDSGNLNNAWMWDIWLDRYATRMITGDGRLIPLIAAAGNHETNDDSEEPEKKAPFYFAYLPQGGQSYFSRRLNAQTMLYVLDSGHVVPHAGAQGDWLSRQLAENEGLPNRLAVYHVPLFPSFRPYDYDKSREGREAWLGLFDAHHLDVCFENHDHAFKRSKLLRGGQPDPEGTLYLGDGNMGVKPRKIVEVRPYLERAESTSHFWVVDIAGEQMRYRAVDAQGEVFDEYPQQ